MPESTAPHAPAITQPQPVLKDSGPPPRPAPAAPRQRGPRATFSGMGDALIAGALVMAAAGTARITWLRRVMRRDRGKSSAG
jgi:hypothetical protein